VMGADGPLLACLGQLQYSNPYHGRGGYNMDFDIWTAGHWHRLQGGATLVPLARTTFVDAVYISLVTKRYISPQM